MWTASIYKIFISLYHMCRKYELFLFVFHLEKLIFMVRILFAHHKHASYDQLEVP